MEKQLTTKQATELIEAILSLKSAKECKAFLRDLCTLSEIEAMPFGTECVVEAPDGSSQSIGRIVEFGFIEFGVMKEKESAKHLIKSGYKITEL